MADRRARAAGRATRTPALPPLRPATRVSLTVATIAALASVLISLSFRFTDFDLWEHVAIGRAIWTLRQVPHQQLWTWPTYGAPDVNVEWGYQALLWPLWHVAGLAGVQGWNWLAAIAAFALVWTTARRMGARGHLPLLLIALAALTYRQRSVGRPETLAALLLAGEIAILEARRRGGRPPVWAIPALMLVWINCHITWVLGLAVLIVYLAAGRRPSGSGRQIAPRPTGGLLILAASLAVLLVNPFGLQAITEPFRYAFSHRQEPLFRGIGELMPLDWRFNLRNGLPALMILWPLLVAWRAARRRLDVVEVLLCVLITVLTLLARRLVGMWVLVATPFLARDLDEWARTRRWPQWLASPGRRATALLGLGALLSIPEWTRPGFPLGLGVDPTTVPVAACDVMDRLGIRGRGFNPYELGSYLLWRFWPERQRLPFMDIRQAGTPEIRSAYLAALGSAPGWQRLDAQFRFDYVLLRRLHVEGDHLLEVLDADSSWAMVFTDDAAALYVRRAGPWQAAADSLGYRLVSGSSAKLGESWALAMRDSVVRGRFSDELRRMARESPQSSTAQGLLATVSLFEGRMEESRRYLLDAHRIDPHLPRYHERLGGVLLGLGRPQEAVLELETARREKEGVGYDYLLGVAYLQLGDRARARAAFVRAQASPSAAAAASDSIATIDRWLREHGGR